MIRLLRLVTWKVVYVWRRKILLGISGLVSATIYKTHRLHIICTILYNIYIYIIILIRVLTIYDDFDYLRVRLGLRRCLKEFQYNNIPTSIANTTGTSEYKLHSCTYLACATAILLLQYYWYTAAVTSYHCCCWPNWLLLLGARGHLSPKATTPCKRKCPAYKTLKA